MAGCGTAKPGLEPAGLLRVAYDGNYEALIVFEQRQYRIRPDDKGNEKL
jgi:hypothetical protein